MRPHITLIAAMTRDRIIGSESGGIPWSLQRDKEHFRSRTEKRWLLVGRKTYEEMTGWFENRIPIVLTRSRSFRPDSPAHRVATSVRGAIAIAEGNGAGELVICGGSEVYHAALPFADTLIVTEVSFENEVSDAVRFPEFREDPAWTPTYRETWKRNSKNTCDAELQIYQKRVKNSDRSS